MVKKFFADRNGFDPYSVFLLIFSLMFFQTMYLWIIGVLLAGYSLFRILSKDKQKRLNELAKFNRIIGQYIFFINSVIMKIINYFKLSKRRYQERKTSTLLKCPNCKKVLRLPRHKGKLEVSCPVCSNHFMIKT